MKLKIKPLDEEIKCVSELTISQISPDFEGLGKQWEKAKCS